MTAARDSNCLLTGQSTYFGKQYGDADEVVLACFRLPIKLAAQFGNRSNRTRRGRSGLHIPSHFTEVTMVARQNWAPHVNRILRSGHYTWIGDGLAGHKVEHALTRILVDAMHMCHRENLDWESVLSDSTRQFLEEEKQSV